MRNLDTEELVVQYSKDKQSDLRDAIVLRLSGLVESIARRFVGSGEPLEDLIQEGYLGLLNALDLFDPNKGVKFTTYATHLVIGQIKHYLRDKGKIIKEPAWLQELNHKINRVIHEITLKRGRPPMISEIADFIGMTAQAVEEVLTTREIFKVSSLDTVQEDDEGEWGYDLDKMTCEDTHTFQLPIEERLVLDMAMRQLKDIEQKVIQLFFYEGLNQTEVAHQLSISCNYVSHILRNATQKLRRILTEEELLDQQKRLRAAQESGDFETRAVDQHTGLYSREYLESRLEEEIQRTAYSGETVAIALFELQGIEQLHRFFGEFTLSELLVQAANEARAAIRKADLIARYETYTLGALLPYAGDHVPQIAQRIRNRLEHWMLATFKNSPIQGRIHIGWATYPQEGSRPSDLYKAAGQRLQDSKSDAPLDDDQKNAAPQAA